MKEEVAKILVKWNMPTRWAAINEIIAFVKKAFGGCELCYGKGYSTTINQYSDESSGKKWPEQDMIFCICDRAKSLKKILHYKIDAKIERIKGEMVSNNLSTYAIKKFNEFKTNV